MTINPVTHAFNYFTVPYTNSLPGEIAAGPDGNIWFADGGTSSIGVAVLATSSLVVSQPPPSSVTAGSPFGLTVEAEDSSGNLITSFNGTVTVALANNPSGATLGGTLSVTAQQGVATFSGLTLTTAGSGYTLAVSSNGLDSATTTAITVTPAASSQLLIQTQPSATATAGQAFTTQPVVEETDQYGNVETGRQYHGGHGRAWAAALGRSRERPRPRSPEVSPVSRTWPTTRPRSITHQVHWRRPGPGDLGNDRGRPRGGQPARSSTPSRSATAIAGQPFAIAPCHLRGRPVRQPGDGRQQHSDRRGTPERDSPTSGGRRPPCRAAWPPSRT